MTKKQIQLLNDLLAQPTAPFKEQHVIRFVSSILESQKIPFFLDPVGNIVVGVSSRQQYLQMFSRKTKEPVRVYMAHMDHPGFHGVRWLSPRRISVKWYGGSPVKYLAGQSVWLADDNQKLAVGKLTSVKLVKEKWAVATAEVVIAKDVKWARRPAAKKLFGSFNFRSPVWLQGQRLYTNAADDLVGVYAVINTAIELKRRNQLAKASFIGLLTRAEEVGFVGAVGHFKLSWLSQKKRKVVCVSLEASRTLSGAEIGKGPVVRLGDRRTIFHTDATEILTSVASKILPGNYQRRVMDGGSCEATAATAFGFPAIGISLPLGNYHNRGTEGGSDCPRIDGPAPEFVNINDIDKELKLCLGLMKSGLPWLDAWKKPRQALIKRLTESQHLLKR